MKPSKAEIIAIAIVSTALTLVLNELGIIQAVNRHVRKVVK